MSLFDQPACAIKVVSPNTFELSTDIVLYNIMYHLNGILFSSFLRTEKKMKDML